jgi:hypothetical protein
MRRGGVKDRDRRLGRLRMCCSRISCSWDLVVTPIFRCKMGNEGHWQRDLKGGKRRCMSLFDLVETATRTLCESQSRLNCRESG